MVEAGFPSGLGGNFERAFVRLSGAFGRPGLGPTQVGNGKEFPTEQPNICCGPLSAQLRPHTVLLGGGCYSQNVVC